MALDGDPVPSNHDKFTLILLKESSNDSFGKLLPNIRMTEGWAETNPSPLPVLGLLASRQTCRKGSKQG